MINSFSGAYAFLSNFYLCEIELEGMFYSSVEHAYQAAKTLNLNERRQIQNLPYAGQAKKMGCRVSLRSGWEKMKLQIMEEFLCQKFKKGSELADQLLQTDNEVLVEGNGWGDTYWGVCRGKGQNHLGKLLMKIRNELRTSKNSK